MLITLSNYKQLSYLARAIMVLTLVCFFWMAIEVGMRFGSVHHTARKIIQPEPPIFMPFYPNFFDFFSQCTGIYEGIPLIPSLYSNSRRHENFELTMKSVTTMVTGYALLISPLAVLTYGTSLKEVVLLNLKYGLF